VSPNLCKFGFFLNSLCSKSNQRYSISSGIYHFRSN